MFVEICYSDEGILYDFLLFILLGKENLKNEKRIKENGLQDISEGLELVLDFFVDDSFRYYVKLKGVYFENDIVKEVLLVVVLFFFVRLKIFNLGELR